MEDCLEISLEEVEESIDRVANMEQFCQDHGVPVNLKQAFWAGQLFPPNSEQGALRDVLMALGYEFGDDQSVKIV